MTRPPPTARRSRYSAPDSPEIGVKFTYTFDLGDDWTHACEVVAQDDPPDFSRAPAHVRTSLPVRGLADRA